MAKENEDMMDKHLNSEAASGSRGPEIGKSAAKRREQLRRLEETRRNTLARLNLARAELAQAVAEDEARARRRLRNEQLQDQKRLKFVLGGLVLNVMRETGTQSFTISSQDLLRLTEKERQLLDTVWTVVSGAASANWPLAAPAKDCGVDLEV